MVQIYILGILIRFGPQYGYQIKKIISNNLSDFTQIKLPLIYYHLDKMQKDGLLSIIKDKYNNHTEKIIYSVTDKGRDDFITGLKNLLNMEYRPSFDSDAVFYFSDNINKKDLTEHLKIYIEKLKMQISIIEKHKSEVLTYIPDEIKSSSEAIFLHHELHYRAELEWAKQVIQIIK